MGDYLTRTQLIAKVGLATVTILAGDQEAAENQAKVNAAIADAEAEANGYLSAQFDTPLDPAPLWLIIPVVRITLWNLLSATGYQPNSPDEAIKYNYDRAIRFLESVRDGKLKPGSAQESGATTPQAQVVAEHPGRALPEGWQDKY